MTKRELTLQAEILTYLRSQSDVYVLRVQANGSSNKGQPDIVLCCNGRFVGIELKIDLDGTYKVTKPQEIRGRQITKAGGVWLAVDSLHQVRKLLAAVRMHNNG